MVVEDTCVGCHMAETPGTTDDGEPLPGHNTVGDHTFAMISPMDGTENLAACTTCHADAEAFAFTAAGDYDGDGTVETNEEEIEGLRELVQGLIEAEGVVFLDHYPYFEIPADAGADVLGAIYNHKFTASGGSAVHNLDYTISLLQLTYAQLAGEPVPGADLVE
jgi:hypothetical protein